jgi:hypothetical protein
VKYLLYLGGLLFGAVLFSIGRPVALCVACNQVEADDDRKYCLVCYQLMIAPLSVGPLCKECKCPLDDKKVIEKRINGEKCCDACFDLFVTVNEKDFFVTAQDEYLREVQRRKRAKDND